MHVTYVPANNIACLAFRQAGAEVETLRISDELHIDIAPDGTLFGIELLNANTQLRALGGDRLIVEGPSGHQASLPLELVKPD
jgi:uncharacterized protein YuzE